MAKQYDGTKGEVIDFLTDPAGLWHDRLQTGVSARELRDTEGKAFRQLGLLSRQVEQFRIYNDGEGGSPLHPKLELLKAVPVFTLDSKVSLASLAALRTALAVVDPKQWHPAQTAPVAETVVSTAAPPTESPAEAETAPSVRITRIPEAVRGKRVPLKAPTPTLKNSKDIFDYLRKKYIRKSEFRTVDQQWLFLHDNSAFEELSKHYQQIRSYRQTPGMKTILKVHQEMKDQFDTVLRLDIVADGKPINETALNRLEQLWQSVQKMQRDGSVKIQLQVPTLEGRKAERDPLYVKVDQYLDCLAPGTNQEARMAASAELSKVAKAAINIRAARGVLPPHIKPLLENTMQAIVGATNQRQQMPLIPLEFRSGAALGAAVEDVTSQSSRNVVSLRPEKTAMQIAMEKAKRPKGPGQK